MGTPSEHAAMCQPSAFERWSHCTASACYELNFPSESSEYTEEGRLAHSICELYGKKKFTTLIGPRKFTTELNKLKKQPLYSDEMLRTAEFYVQYLAEKAGTFEAVPHLAFEVKVDLTDYIPGGFGTCDCVMIGGDTLHITDYKHGKGVAVSAVENGQMRLYALGALKQYSMIYGDAIKKVSTAIVQPRITEDVTEDLMTVEDLLEWGEWVKPIAQTAYNGPGETVSGPWCQFCRGCGPCRERSEKNMELEQFTTSVPEGQVAEELRSLTLEQKALLGVPNLLTDDEVGDLLNRGADLVSWYNRLKDYAQRRILDGHSIPGWRVVEGRSNRAFTSTDDAFKAIIASGVNEEMLYDREPKTLTEVERLLGKKAFAEIAGPYVTKPQGKPTLVTEDNEKPDYQPVKASDYADLLGIVQNG